MRLESTTLPSGIVRLTLVGRLDLEGVTKIEDKFAFAILTKTAPVLVDISQVDFMASIGIRMLLMSAKALQRRGSRLVLYKPQHLIGETLATSSIDLLIPTYDDFDAGCTDLLQTASAAV
jgi:anti-anti-sigma factor